ncbi:L-serine ammonia-lyase, iron-sulfur-dependent, subunit alpha [Anaerorhabdus furcosa]|uniref:L-serine ammonia-lyase n=1 Tax=Anaerorhabdus furcosa TaxID=118967 RepID=A0A1T4PH54_9FIRM|nr:L-serine ammonia-lyase, iron-sulfur-dependent, subunit alpha [Anaerorhabdus furcosa]SJZ90586.1 L-serine dehydratase [Anaerorhabdus furcosa]
MQSLRELYKIGPGPSSSHTLAPKRACLLFLEEYGQLPRYEVDLFGSLSLTGKGHFTDKIIEDTLAPSSVEIHFNATWEERHPNGFYLRGYNQENVCIALWTVFSLGGGSIDIKEKKLSYNEECYPEKSLDEIKELCTNQKINLVDYVLENEDDNIEQYLNGVLTAMLNSVHRGINATGILPGRLNVEKCAKSLNIQAQTTQDDNEKTKLLLMSYAYGACEENASLGEVVTAPTLGACGVLASLMYYYYNDVGISRNKLIRALMVAGIFGNLIKTNATISGAIGGCQAEVGTACAMASAAAAYLNDLNIKQIEYAAEIGIEHNLGLTCDPVEGYVIIPCIERNAVAVLRALDACTLSKYMYKIKPNKVTFDMIVNTMNYTGQKIAIELKETSLGGLANEFKTKDEPKILLEAKDCYEEKQKIILPLTEDDIELEDTLVFDDIVLDENDEPTSPIKFKL